MLVASEEATEGSVMAKHDLIFPASRSVSHSSCDNDRGGGEEIR